MADRLLTENHDPIEAARAKFAQGDTEEALGELEAFLISSPDDFKAQIVFAQMLGDSGLQVGGPLGSERLERAIRMLEALTLRLRNQSAEDRWWVRRHLYYFRGDHLRNYRLGVEEVARGNKKGYLSQGFGATGHALKLNQSTRNRKRAQLWAKRGEEAWKYLFKREPKKPGRLCNLAIALAVQGRFTEADKTIHEAARLAGVPIEAFADLREELREIWRGIREAGLPSEEEAGS
jgi:tetratricopeptide (TPR) repeat protein